MVSYKRLKLACPPIKDPDQTALIRVFDGHSMGSLGFNVSLFGQLRLWSDCTGKQTVMKSSCKHMPTCILCWLPAQ